MSTSHLRILLLAMTFCFCVMSYAVNAGFLLAALVLLVLQLVIPGDRLDDSSHAELEL